MEKITSNALKCGKYNIDELFKNWFIIPIYQRSYIWEKEQVLELLTDIKVAYETNPEQQYFLGSFVFKENNILENNTAEYEVLDGQQRLTTLLLIFAVLRDVIIKRIKNRNTNNSTEQFIDEEIEKTLLETCQAFVFRKADKLRKIPEKMTVTFDIRDNVKTFIDNCIKKEEGTSEEKLINKTFENNKSVSVKNMTNAIPIIREFIESNYEAIVKDDGLGTFLISKVLIIYVATAELDDAFRLFTILNNRGVKLLNSDILKANNLRYVPTEEKAKAFAQKWEEMENYFEDDFDNFLSNIRFMLTKKKQKATLLKEFNEFVFKATPSKMREGEEFICFLYEHFKTYTNLLDDSDFKLNNKEAYNYISLMDKGLGVDYWKAAVMFYFRKYSNNKLVEFLKKLENKLSADWILSFTPTQRIEHTAKILTAIENSKSVQELLDSKDFDYKIEDLLKCVEGDIYGKSFAKYLLMKLNLVISECKTTILTYPTILSIEHILPQNPSKDSQWLKDFSETDLLTLTNIIGNLTLISRRKNSGLSNSDYKIKIAKYLNKEIETSPNTVRIITKYHEKWGPKELKENNKFVIKELFKHYISTLSQTQKDQEKEFITQFKKKYLEV